MGVEVVRPNIAGLMGAYGAALYSKNKSKGNGKSKLANKETLKNFVHDIKVTNCGMCSNNCRLTINSFGGGKIYCRQPL